MESMTGRYGKLDPITRAEYRRGDWECVGDDEFIGNTLVYSPSRGVYRILIEWDSDFSHIKHLDSVLDLFDALYKNLTPGVSRHAEIREIYAHLAGYDPDARMADCFWLVQDICQFCSSPESVYPYPDGEKWTEEEIARFHRWQTMRNWRDEE